MGNPGNGPYLLAGPYCIGMIIVVWTTIAAWGVLSPMETSAQVKAAVAQVGDRNWNWEKEILCPTTTTNQVFCGLLPWYL